MTNKSEKGLSPEDMGVSDESGDDQEGDDQEKDAKEESEKKLTRDESVGQDDINRLINGIENL